MERLDVTTRGGKCISLQRRGKEFQVSDKYGCLPNGWSVDDWKRSMEYTLPTLETNPKAVLIANGLKLHTKNKDAEDDKPKENYAENKAIDEISLNEVKKKHDVDAKALEQSREVLEAEGVNGGNLRSTSLEDFDEKELAKQDVQDAKSKVQLFKRVLARVRARVDEFDDEVST
jgi:hypothetical protein